MKIESRRAIAAATFATVAGIGSLAAIHAANNHPDQSNQTDKHSAEAHNTGATTPYTLVPGQTPHTEIYPIEGLSETPKATTSPATPYTLVPGQLPHTEIYPIDGTSPTAPSYTLVPGQTPHTEIYPIQGQTQLPNTGK